MTTRRGFLKAILALGIAPAIVRADSLMKIVVPKPILDDYILPNILGAAILDNEFTLETWISRPRVDSNIWNHIAVVRSIDKDTNISKYEEYINGTVVPNGTLDVRYPNTCTMFKDNHLHIESKEPVFLDEYRVTKGVARRIQEVSSMNVAERVGMYLHGNVVI